FEGYDKFLDKIFEKLSQLGIDTSEYKIDHIAYSSNSSENYEKAKEDLKDKAKLVREVTVSDRRVGVYELSLPLVYKDNAIKALELIEPKAGEAGFEGLEHIEFTITNDFMDIVNKYPNLDWITKDINR